MPNQHRGVSNMSRVLAYLHTHPSGFAHEIAEALGITVPAVSTALHGLKIQALVDGAVPQGTISRAKRWTVVDELAEDPRDRPRQIVTTTWDASPDGHWIDFALANPASVRQLQGEQL